MRGLVTLVLIAGVLTPCGCRQDAVERAGTNATASGPSTEPAAAPASPRPAALDALPWDERIGIEQALAAGDLRHAPRLSETGPVLGLPGSMVGEFTSSGAHLSFGAHATTLAMVAIGREGALAAVPASGAPEIDGVEVRTARGPNAFEWWRSLPSGLEHGITVAERPAGEGDLLVEVAVGGSLSPHLVSGDAVELRDAAGVPVARYAHLFVLDAAGAHVPAHLGVEGGRIVLAVADARARYPLVIDPLVTAHEATLVAPDGAMNDAFGSAVALAADGSRALVGVPGDSAPLAYGGSVRVFLRTATSWVEEATLVPAVPGGGDVFGTSVAISADGSRALVGAPSDANAGGVRVGSARVFVRTGTTWTEEATLFAIGAAVNDDFGRSVALSADGSRALVGAPRDDTAGAVDTGSARVFVRTGTAWAQEATLLASDLEMDDQLGTSVAISSDGSRALVGAPLDDDTAGANVGTARVFLRTGTAWAEEATLLAPDGAANDGLGASVALASDGTRALVGTPSDNTSVTNLAGSARVFLRTGTAWAQEATLFATDAAFADRLGSCVALSADGSRALAGVATDDARGATDDGSARPFLRTGTVWTAEPPLVHPGSPGTGMDDQFGYSVALSGDGSRALVGAALDDTTAGTNAGSAHVFTLNGSIGSTCGSDAACTSGFCTDGVCCAARCAGGNTDCQACSASLTGGANGTCGLLSATAAPTFTCRAAVTVCDVAETCTSTSAACPADAFASAVTVCQPAVSICDAAETCSGTSSVCPGDVFAPASVVCRAAISTCDAAERCTGSGTVCPRDDAAPTGTVCRAEVGPCDSTEVCDGVSFACPGDVLEPMGNVCGTGMGDCALPAMCTGTSPACPSAGFRPAGTACRPAASPCDVADACDGISQLCTDVFAPDTTLCGAAPTDVCDAPDHCAGTSGDCVADFRSGVECRASSGACDPVDFCSGSAAECPPDAVHPAGTACRVASDPLCDPEETCDGVAASCPADVTTCGLVDAGADGGRADAGAADAGGLDTGGALDAGAEPAAVGSCACRLTARHARLPALGLSLVLVLALVSARRRRR